MSEKTDRSGLIPAIVVAICLAILVVAAIWAVLAPLARYNVYVTLETGETMRLTDAWWNGSEICGQFERVETCIPSSAIRRWEKR